MQPHLVKKTIELDERVIRKLRLIFKADTDKEAINRALQLVSEEEEEIIQTHESLAGTLSLKNPL